MELASHDSLLPVLERFDGKEIDTLRLVVSNQVFNSQGLNALLSFIENEDENFQIGASWIILNHAQLHHLIGEEEKNRILEFFSRKTHWQTLLHLLQLFPHLSLSTDDCLECLPILEGLAQHQRPFVRAWAYSALYQIADSEESLRDAVTEKLHMAFSNDSGAVRARIRNATSKSRWFQNTEKPDDGINSTICEKKNCFD